MQHSKNKNKDTNCDDAATKDQADIYHHCVVMASASIYFYLLSFLRSNQNKHEL